MFSNMHETWSKCPALLLFCLPQACPRVLWSVYLSICATAIFQLGICAFTAAAVPFLALLEEHSKGLGGQAESMCVLFHEHILMNILVARGAYPFIHYCMQYQNKPGVSSGV